jgi:hypothetical protein
MCPASAVELHKLDLGAAATICFGADREDFICVNPQPGRVVSAGPVTTDAELAVFVRGPNGELARTVLVGGSALKRQ